MSLRASLFAMTYDRQIARSEEAGLRSGAFDEHRIAERAAT